MTPTIYPVDQSLTIRIATPADGVALTRLAQLDSAQPLGDGRALVAEVDGELVAALRLSDGGAIANPFRHTAGIVALLETRAADLASSERPRLRRRRLLGSLRISLAGRA